MSDTRVAMPTYDALPEHERELIDGLAYEIRLMLRAEGYTAPSGDHFGAFEEALAVLLTHCERPGARQ